MLVALSLLAVTYSISYAQYPASCTSVGSRTNGNGQANSCPNVSGTPYASNFVGTIYATVPVTAKTGTLVFRYTGASTSLKPLAITSVWSTNPITTPVLVAVGPASVPVQVGSDIEVTYCFYGTNLPNAGVLSFLFTNPETGLPVRICSYNANCASGCGIVANPSGLAVPVKFSSFTGSEKNGTAQLQWTTAQESNNKGFTVQRSFDGSNFTSLGFVSSKYADGNSNNSTTYSFSDNQFGAGKTAWYRLQQEDLDGKFSLSAVVAVRSQTNKSGFKAYAGNNNIHVVGNGIIQGELYQLKVYDVSGRMVYAGSMLSNKETIIPAMAKGTYYVRLHSANGKINNVLPVSIK